MIDEKKLIKTITDYFGLLMGSRIRILDVADFISDIKKIIEAQPKVGEWIPCSERLPEERVNPITNDYYIYPVTCDFDGVKDIRYYHFGNGHWHYGFQIMDDYVKAWMPLPEPYKESED